MDRPHATPPSTTADASASPAPADVRRWVRAGSIAVSGAGFLAGLAAWWWDAADLAAALWSSGSLVVLAVLLGEIVISLRRGEVGLDLVAALAMGSSLAVGETLAAAVIALMYAGGQALEAFAEGRAARDMNALLGRVPRTAIVHRDGALTSIPIEDIVPGDRLLIRVGDVVPADGTAEGGPALLDQSAITGESLPVSIRGGAPVLSGSTNVGTPFDLVASETAARSTYAGIVRLVEEATRSSAPITRLADRFAILFTLATLVIAGLAWWLSGDPVRAVAVLVVATPCPLILAVPVAIVAGISRSARIGVLVKGGSALETLGRVETLVIDKTGTLTHGSAVLAEIAVAPGWTEDDVLRLAATLDQASAHVVARALVDEAHRRGLVLSRPDAARESPGDGVEGIVEGVPVRVGGRRFVTTGAEDPHRLAAGSALPGSIGVSVAAGGTVVGTIHMRDGLRDGVGATLAGLRDLGIRRIVLATGDRKDIAEAVAGPLGLDAVIADLTPEGKIDLVRREKAAAAIMMVGDGVNDAPALVEADLGVAMGAKGAAAAAEAADVVLLRDSLDGLGDAVRIARRARAIALQSVSVGLGLSLLGMLAAAAGYLPPLYGALFQEAIDVAVILNALRALRD